MKKLCITLLCAMTLSGCAIYKAATAPEPIQLQNVKVGASRINIVGTLGVPKMSDTKGDVRTDVHEFTCGSPAASKARIVLYIAGDFFTAALSELVFWPMELAFGQGTEGRAVITYGMNDIAKSVLLTKKDGTAWDFDEPAAPPAPNQGTDYSKYR